MNSSAHKKFIILFFISTMLVPQITKTSEPNYSMIPSVETLAAIAFLVVVPMIACKYYLAYIKPTDEIIKESNDIFAAQQERLAFILDLNEKIKPEIISAIEKEFPPTNPNFPSYPISLFYEQVLCNYCDHINQITNQLTIIKNRCSRSPNDTFVELQKRGEELRKNMKSENTYEAINSLRTKIINEYGIEHTRRLIGC